jgi:shikimate dehydrogenase
MTIRGSTRLLGILGNPLSHSYSPAMHNAGIESLGLDLAYLPFQVEEAGLGPLLNALKSVGFLGVNVTMPHKRAVLPFLDEISEISQKMGVVNTIVNRGGKLFGTTTDPEGFLRGFAEAGHSFDGKSVLILGNGGSARTIAFALSLMASPSGITLAARDMEKSGVLAKEVLDKTGAAVALLPLDALGGETARFGVIVNTTPLGMHPDTAASPLRPEWLHPGQIVYDIINNPGETALMRAARARGGAAVGGLGMLVHQGLASFELWTGRNPGAAVFYEGIRRQQQRQAIPT